MKAVFVAVFILINEFSQTSGLECQPPKFGKIVHLDNVTVSFGCEEGFLLLGEENGACDPTTGKYQESVKCLPIYEGNVTCGKRCPKSFRYLFDYEPPSDPSQEELDIIANMTDVWTVDQMQKSPTGRINCQNICKLSKRTACFHIKNNRRLKKKCINCIMKKCGVIFWG